MLVVTSFYCMCLVCHVMVVLILQGNFADVLVSYIVFTSLTLPSGHATFRQRRININVPSWCFIDVDSTLYKRRVPAGLRSTLLS